jgi:hypothetical protein
MNPQFTYSEIDQILMPWAKKLNSNVFTECKDEEIRTISVLDNNRDEYHLFVSPNYETKEKIEIAGSCLIKRHNKKHTFYRERKDFDYRERVDLTELEPALNRCLKQITKWGAEPVGI